jgi:hypothetical protein
MPQLQVVDLSPTPYQGRETPLQKTLEGFTRQNRQNRDTDELAKIYKQYQDDGQDIDRAMQSLQTNPNLSPSRRIEATNQMLELRKQNAVLQQQAAKQQAERDKAQREAEKEEKDLKSNQAKIADLEKRNNLEPGALKAYEDDPKMAAQVIKQPKGNQADREVDPEQLRRIEKTVAEPGFNELSPAEKNLKLLRNGVSKENAKSVIEPGIEEAKIRAKEPKPDVERERIMNEIEAKADAAFYQDQVSQFPMLEAQGRTLDAADKLNKEGVTGGFLDQALEKAGLMQFTSEGRREFVSLAKDALKNQDIKNILGSQISQMEFKFFADATINPNFSQEANDRIIKKEKLVLRYKKLYADIANNIVRQNGGKIPRGFTAMVNEQFTKQSQGLSKEVSTLADEFDAIQDVPSGYVLMYDKKRRPLHVPEDEVQKYSELGASQT